MENIKFMQYQILEEKFGSLTNICNQSLDYKRLLVLLESLNFYIEENNNYTSLENNSFHVNRSKSGYSEALVLRKLIDNQDVYFFIIYSGKIEFNSFIKLCINILINMGIYNNQNIHIIMNNIIKSELLKDFQEYISISIFYIGQNKIQYMSDKNSMVLFNTDEEINLKPKKLSELSSWNIKYCGDIKEFKSIFIYNSNITNLIDRNNKKVGNKKIISLFNKASRNSIENAKAIIENYLDLLPLENQPFISQSDILYITKKNQNENNMEI